MNTLPHPDGIVNPAITTEPRHYPHVLAKIPDTAATREFVALALERNEAAGRVYRYDVEKLCHLFRSASDTEIGTGFHRLMRAVYFWRSHWGGPDSTDPGDIDPAVRMEFEDTEELKAACDALFALVDAGSGVGR